MTTTKCTCPTDVAELCERTLEQKPYYCATHAPEGSTSTPDPLASTIRQVLDQHTGATRRDLARAIAGKHRQLGVTVDDAIARAVADGYIADDGAGWRPSRRTP